MIWTSKRPLPLSSLKQAEASLDLAYRFWSGLRREGLLPSRAAIDTPQFRLLLPRIDWLRPAPATRGSAPELGRMAPLATARRGSGAEPLELQTLLQEDLRTVAFTGSPLYQEVVVENRHSVDSWRHLLLPTARNGMRVQEIMQLVSLRVAAPCKLDRLSA